jgi:hypothetical protein
MASSLKQISAAAIPAALEKAERYRLLNQAWEAESIARDVLAVAPDHQGAIVMLLLSLTDQFGANPRCPLSSARELLPRLTSVYEQTYYAGVVCERWAKAELAAGVPGYAVHQHLVDAMTRFEAAERLAPAGNEDALLRWNACARLIEKEQLSGQGERVVEFDDDVPTGSRQQIRRRT